MRLKWYGTATILLESGNTRLLFDPYCKPLARGAPVPLAEARTADAVFITHPHLDHFRDIDAFGGKTARIRLRKGPLHRAQEWPANGLYARDRGK